MKTIFIGIDISKGWLDYVPIDDQVKILGQVKRVDNTVEGILSMTKALAKKYAGSELWFCFEHTGNYGLLLCSILQGKGVRYSLVPALEVKRSLGITRGKTDQLDAKRLAEYAATRPHKLVPTVLPSQDLMQVKNLLAYRAQLIKIRTGLINSLKSYYEAEKVVNLTFITNSLEEKIESLKRDISNTEGHIQTIIKDSKELRNNYTLISSVKGIGLVIAALMLVYTNNFSSFSNPRKFNCFTGLAPFESRSGLSTGKTKTSHFRHKYMKTILFNGAHSASMYDPQIKAYYQRKKEEGKHHLSIINAIACKLVYRAFATVKRKSPYVVLAH